MKPAETRKIIRTAQTRSGYDRNQAKLCKMTRIAERTFKRRMADPGEFKLKELRRIIMITHMLDDEILKLMRG